MKANIADKIRLIIMILLPITALGYLYYSLETYNQVVHNESGFFVCIYAFACMMAEATMWMLSRKKGTRYTVIALIALVILLFVWYVGEKIPFCVECDHVTAEDLGFLTYWITPCGEGGI